MEACRRDKLQIERLIAQRAKSLAQIPQDIL
jgi:hypothetical protein